MYVFTWLYFCSIFEVLNCEPRILYNAVKYIAVKTKNRILIALMSKSVKQS